MFGDIDCILDFELEYEKGGELEEIFNIIENGGSQSRSQIVDKALSLNMKEVIKEEFEDSVGPCKVIRQYPYHFEMSVPTNQNFNYAALYQAFELMKEQLPIEGFTTREGSLREVIKSIIQEEEKANQNLTLAQTLKRQTRATKRSQRGLSKRK